MKSDKNIVKDILIAQGLDGNTEPTKEAIEILGEYGYLRWKEGNEDARYESDW